jgi:hypothetical protein
MKNLRVAKVEGSEKQVTIDFDSRTIVEGSLENGRHTVCLQNGERLSISVKDGRLIEVA